MMNEDIKEIKRQVSSLLNKEENIDFLWTLVNRDKIPKNLFASGIYILLKENVFSGFTDKNNSFAYLGESINLSRRLHNHNQREKSLPNWKWVILIWGKRFSKHHFRKRIEEILYYRLKGSPKFKLSNSHQGSSYDETQLTKSEKKLEKKITKFFNFIT